MDRWPRLVALLLEFSDLPSERVISPLLSSQLLCLLVELCFELLHLLCELPVIGHLRRAASEQKSRNNIGRGLELLRLLIP